MPFSNDTGLAEDVGTFYGKYVATFVSETEQVRADIFNLDDRLVAHVSFPTGLEAYEVTDRYADELWEFADDQGFKDRIELIFS